MKHLKKLLAAYRATFNNPTAELSATTTRMAALFDSLAGPTSDVQRMDVERVVKVLLAVVTDMREEDAKSSK